MVSRYKKKIELIYILVAELIVMLLTNIIKITRKIL